MTPLIHPATTDTDLEAVRALCWDYRTALMAVSPVEERLTQTFYPEPKYAALMADLAQAHARPDGIILLATDAGQPVGCAMSHALFPDTSEIKRLFVTPAARGSGVARRLVQALLDQATADGFARVVLDTSVNLAPACALYRATGFRERGPYQDIPADALPHLVFFEATL